MHKRGDAFRKQVIDAATIKLETTASVMKTVTEKYDEASKRLVDIQSEIGNIQAELSGLTTANMDLVCNLTESRCGCGTDDGR